MPQTNIGTTTTTGTLKEVGTTVRNISGQAMFFPFLGRHGRTLAANEAYTHAGDLREWCAQHRSGARWMPYLEESLNKGQLSIENTPAVILYDYALSKPRQLELNNSLLGFSDPLSAPTPNSTFVGA